MKILRGRRSATDDPSLHHYSVIKLAFTYCSARRPRGHRIDFYIFVSNGGEVSTMIFKGMVSGPGGPTAAVHYAGTKQIKVAPNARAQAAPASALPRFMPAGRGKIYFALRSER
ncbi:hypothetical protein EVAR_101306_1 [Eumeta japonica]|uniref:Uncharacterized protein n=1 Tax=Eumeta variegata TaxID=151549 RepID=A0A4C2AHM3_EUMVA|nr:hypothetical protein EVAR_101306_1 [Eumeta japonica]